MGAAKKAKHKVKAAKGKTKKVLAKLSTRAGKPRMLRSTDHACVLKGSEDQQDSPSVTARHRRDPPTTRRRNRPAC